MLGYAKPPPNLQAIYILVTRNERDFEGIEIVVFNPFNETRD
ncbi:MAG: hypothetical protein VKN72_04840 [Nostocales cyanobacterium 94392]|nr:hypothetical protein [Nostocales cyanobacterium 94392]